jgi:hypothetical protein
VTKPSGVSPFTIGLGVFLGLIWFVGTILTLVWLTTLNWAAVGEWMLRCAWVGMPFLGAFVVVAFIIDKLGLWRR